MTPKISILIPLYNAAHYIEATIQSALQQTWQNKEVIIVDDGSTDNSLAIAQKFANHQVKVVSQKNQGACTARNRAFRESMGDYIQYLDADDLLHPDKISQQMHRLRSKANAYVAACPWGRFEEGIQKAHFCPDRVWKDMTGADWLVEAWTSGGMMQTACWLTPRALIEQAGSWLEDLQPNPADDGEFFSRVLLASEGVLFEEKSKVYYRTVSAGLSQQKSRRAVESLLQNCILYKKYMLAVRQDKRAKYAIATNFARFMYEHFPTHLDLVQRAEQEIFELGFKKIPVWGGKNFKRLAKIVGFKNGLKWRTRLTKTRNY
ncbi:MAG: glycosyltransferase family 2 protein [Saprospiraceae bacterium]